MKSLFRRAVKNLSRLFFGQIVNDLKHDLEHRASKETQLLLYHMYREMGSRNNVPRLSEVGFRCYSQFEEDGMLLFIFALIGTTNKVAVEICAGDGIECMSANLILNHGWWGYLFDGKNKNVECGREFYRRSKDTSLFPPKITHAWITAENVNEIITQAGINGEVDLLAIDIDGMDYWVWKAITCIRPRVVICETHNVIGPEYAITVPYDPNFVISTPNFHSASLSAMNKLADEKGYRLIGTHRYGFNAIFLRKELAAGLLPTVTPEMCLSDPYSLEMKSSRWPTVKDMNWHHV